MNSSDDTGLCPELDSSRTDLRMAPVVAWAPNRVDRFLVERYRAGRNLAAGRPACRIPELVPRRPGHD